MWIKTGNCLFNTDAISCITETTFETFAMWGDRRVYISDQPILAKIIYALKNNEKFLEIK